MTPRILYIQYGNPAAYPPLQQSSRILAEAGWDVVVLGIEDANTRALNFPPHVRRRLIHLPFVALGWRRILYFLYFSAWVSVWTLRWRPHWIYASDLYATPAAWLLSFLPFVHVLYHEHDAPGATRLLARLCMRARARLARRAALCVLPNAARAARFVKRLNPRRVLMVWNCPSRLEVPPTQNAESLSPRWGDDLWLLYHGSVVPSRMRLAVLDALSHLPSQLKLRIIGYETAGHPGYLKVLRERAAQLQLDTRVELLPVMPRAELLEWGKRSDVGLALMPKVSGDWNEQAMSGASNKPFDYMACGLALLISDIPDWVSMYQETGFGLACDPEDATSIARTLRQFLDAPAARRAMGRSAREKILESWNYETQFAPVKEFLESKLPPGFGEDQRG